MSQQAISSPLAAPITVGSGRWLKPEPWQARKKRSVSNGLSPSR
jgi:hypothetical protein